MAKYEELYDDVQEVFDMAFSATDLEQYIKIKVVANDKLRKIYKPPMKVNDMTKFLTDGKVEVVLEVNQVIFDRLPKEQQEDVALEAMTYLGYDTEKDKIIIAKPDVTTFNMFVGRISWDRYVVLQESIKSLYDEKQNAENIGEEA